MSESTLSAKDAGALLGMLTVSLFVMIVACGKQEPGRAKADGNEGPPHLRIMRARREAMKAVCKSNLKQLGLASCMYANDYGECWPAVAGGKEADGTKSLGLLYDNYMSSLNVYVCPTARALGGKDRADVKWLEGDVINGGYQYDGYTNPRADPMKAMGADFGDVKKRWFGHGANHLDGTNVLYYDGHVEWQNAVTNWYTTDWNIYSAEEWDQWSYSYVRW